MAQQDNRRTIGLVLATVGVGLGVAAFLQKKAPVSGGDGNGGNGGTTTPPQQGDVQPQNLPEVFLELFQ